MDDLFEAMRQNLDGETPPAFREESWQRLEKRLRAQPRSGAFPRWLMFLPLLLLLGATGWLFVQWQLEKQANTLRRQIVHIQTDTIYHSRVIYQTDTVYRMLPTSGRIRPLLPPVDAWTRRGLALTPDRTPLEEPLDLAHAKAPPMEAEKDRTYPPVQQLIDSSTYLTHPLVLEADIQMPEKPSFSLPKRLVEAVRPKAYLAGINGGFRYPLDRDIADQSGFSTQAQLRVILSERVSAWAEAGYAAIQYQTDTPERFPGLPPIMPPRDQLVFREAKIQQQFGQVGLGLRYDLPSALGWTSYIGLGYGWLKPVGGEAVYEFEEDDSGLEFLVERGLESQPAIRHQLLGRIGFHYPFGNRWHWQAEVAYRRNVSGYRAGLKGAIGIQAGFFYQL